jgi:hypothetical protein
MAFSLSKLGLFQKLVQPAGIETPDEASIDHGRGGGGTKSEAVNRFEGHPAIGAGVPAFHAKALLRPLNEPLAAHGLTGFGAAQLKDVLAGKLTTEVVIEGHDAMNLCAGEIKFPCENRNCFLRHKAESVLQSMQDGHHWALQLFVVSYYADRALFAPRLKPAHWRSSALFIVIVITM